MKFGTIQLPPDVVEELAALAARLEADYEDRFGVLGGGFDCWRNSTKFGIESFSSSIGRGSGPMWSTAERFGRWSWRWPVRQWKPDGTIADLEKKLRADIEAFLAAGKPPRVGRPR
ncbi:MAG: hypothetical protein PVS3B2_01830 [Candidatus Dormibacteraceae bacterium]